MKCQPIFKVFFPLNVKCLEGLCLLNDSAPELGKNGFPQNRARVNWKNYESVPVTAFLWQIVATCASLCQPAPIDAVVLHVSPH